MINTDGRSTIASKSSDVLLAQAFDDDKARRNLVLARGPVELPTIAGDILVCPCDVDDISPDCPFHGEQSWPHADGVWPFDTTR